MKKIFLLLFLLPLFLACCKDKTLPYCEEFPDKCVDVREVKDYFYFKLGSYWVYEEESSGKRDSVYVTETSSHEPSVVFSTEVFSTYDDYEYRFYCTGNNENVVEADNMAPKNERSTSVTRTKGKPGDYVGEARCFLFYPYEGLWAYSYGGGYIGFDNILKVDEVLQEYVVLSETFEDVVIISEEHTLVEEQQPTIHYYAPSVGLIKKELLDSNQIWNLVSYHITN